MATATERPRATVPTTADPRVRRLWQAVLAALADGRERTVAELHAEAGAGAGLSLDFVRTHVRTLVYAGQVEARPGTRPDGRPGGAMLYSRAGG